MTTHPPTDILKLNWERGTPHVHLSRAEVERAVQAYSQQGVASFELLSGGCANSNYRVELQNGETVLLRVYTRDASAMQREHKLHQLVAGKIPVPKFLAVFEAGEVLPFPFAIVEFVEGVLFRDLLLQGNRAAITECAFHAGQLLTQLAGIHFPQAGFFDEQLRVRPFSKDQTFDTYVNAQLSQASIQDSLGNKLIDQLQEVADAHRDILVELATHRNLTHADYDPANLLVVQVPGGWRISGVLDWEFALSSTYYMDMGLMLRYAHRLPRYFQEAFIDGIQCSNPELLAPDWQHRVKLMDMVCLLSLCSHNPPDQRPRMYRDLQGLLQFTCQVLR